MDSLSVPHTPTHAAAPQGWLECFLTIARATPERPAVLAAGRILSYGDLDLRSAALAEILRRSGLGPGDFAGVGLDRSPELIVALVAIARSGAAYIPLDPAYPPARIGGMISSAALTRVITTRALADRFPGVITILADEIGSSPVSDPESGGNVMYAIFTSGSTGEPKAASVTKSGFQNLLDWYISELGIGPDDRTLVISSPSFDLTQKNLHAPLATGGRIVLDNGGNYDIPRISALVRDHGVTLLNCTPSAFYPLVDAAADSGYADLSPLRFVILGGEPISIPRLRAWLEHPSCRAEVVNSYGPTECTDICLFHRLHRGNLDNHPFVPLGRKIPHAAVTIRDEFMAPLPAGETGELCIAGAGVGGGYLNDPARTAAAFHDGIYRTGDLAKLHPSGIFEFRGRADQQVKMNGFRIELGEIELVLATHPGVREAIVTASPDRLTAHIRGDAAAPDLRAHLAARLPAYLIPGEFREHSIFPLTPNGKVDRLALAKPATDLNPIVVGNSLESGILALWSEILGRPVADPTANFFDLGGNSIHLAVVHVRLMKLAGREFPITTLFGLPSARAIAGFLAPSPAASAPAARSHSARAAFSNFRRPATR